MDIQGNKIPENIQDKVKKLLVMVERGTPNEQKNAKVLLDSICAKYNISPEELNDEKEFNFIYKSRHHKLFLQVFVNHFGTTKKFMEMESYIRYDGKSESRARMTTAEYIDFKAFWEWHRKNFDAERKRIKAMFEDAYIAGYHLYPTSTCDEWEALEGKRSNNLTQEDLLKMASLANMVNEKSYYKAIEK